MPIRMSTLLLVVAVGLIGKPLVAQDAQPANQPQAQPPQSQPAAGRPIMAKVIAVTGDVQHAPLGEETPVWKPCKLGDTYPPGTMIRSGVRSSIGLQIGEEEPYTAMVLESVGLTILSEAFKTQTTKRVRVGVGYGRVRAGVAEGGLKSDFTIDSPVATLSKRGTWNFALYYERATERFEISLLDRGLVDAIDKVRGRSVTILPGELVTEVMRKWLDEVQVQRNVAFVDLLGQGEVDVAFNRLRTDGLGVLDPGSGSAPLLNLSTSAAQTEFTSVVLETIQDPILLPPPDGGPQPIFRPEGFFGTGRGDQLIPILIDPNSALVKRGFARPGKYHFRRSALESWLKKNQRRR